jgi:hypothetical protein
MERFKGNHKDAEDHKEHKGKGLSFFSVNFVPLCVFAVAFPPHRRLKRNSNRPLPSILKLDRLSRDF